MKIVSNHPFDVFAVLWKVAARILLAFALPLILAEDTSSSPVQTNDVGIVNPGFENGVEGWQPHVEPSVSISPSPDAFEGTGSCLVSQREFFWTGVKQNLLDKLQVDHDYRVSLRAKAVAVDAALKIQIRQTDDRGTQFIELGTLLLNPNSWSAFAGGFHLQVNGDLQELDLLVAGAPDHVADFLVDDVAVSLNDWQANAAARIEAIRKTDLQLNVVNEAGDALANAEVNAQQIRSHFAFGSTMNARVAHDQQYADFFKEHFEWATVEWRVQWKPVEEERGVEVYDLGDATVDFCESNDIQVRGHSIVWPHTNFVPDWLFPLSAAEMMVEVDERVENVTTRYRGRFASWDVCNEMLDHRFYRDHLGDDIVGHIYREAHKFDPDATLFINETGFLDRRNDFRNTELINLVTDLQSRGATVGGLGLQSHFFVNNVSPAAMELVLDGLTSVDLPIWISEYDTVNPDPLERAKQLETFYRYIFSRPEIDGIIMWGFWAGAHWRGAEAALVDEDWTVNAAGQKYFDLIDEWTTNAAGTTDQSGSFPLRGFQGTYRVEARHPDTDSLSQHIVFLPPLAEGAVQQTELVLPEQDGVISIYGSTEDDEIQLDLSDLSKLTIGNQVVPLPDAGNLNGIRVYGLGGSDRLTINGLSAARPTGDRYFLGVDELRVEEAGVIISYEDVETVKLASRRDDDQVLLDDSPGDDNFLSTAELSSMVAEDVRLEAEGFYYATGRDGAGNDRAVMTDSEGLDLGYCNLQYMRIENGNSVRRAIGFDQNEMISGNGGNDRVLISRPIGDKFVHISAEGTEIAMNGRSYKFSEFPLIRLFGVSGNSDILNITDSMFGDEYLLIRDNFLRYDISPTEKVLARHFSGTNVVGSNSGNDVVRIRDTRRDDSMHADADSFSLLSSNGAVHVGTGFDRVEAVGNQGGTNTADVRATNFELLFFGVWELIE